MVELWWQLHTLLRKTQTHSLPPPPPPPSTVSVGSLVPSAVLSLSSACFLEVSICDLLVLLLVWSKITSDVDTQKLINNKNNMIYAPNR